MEGMIVSHVFLGLGKPHFSYIEICISQILQAASTGLGKATGSRWRLRGRLRGLIMQEWRVNQRRKQLGGGAPRREGGGFRAKNEQLELVQNNIQFIQRKYWAKAYAPVHFKLYFGATLSYTMLCNASGYYFILFGAL